MLPYPSKSLQPSSLLYPPPHSRGRIHAYLNLSNSSKESSLPPVILPLHPCPFPVHSIKTWAFFKGAVFSCIISCISTEPLTSSGCWSSNHPENFSHSQKSLLMLIQMTQPRPCSVAAILTHYRSILTGRIHFHQCDSANQVSQQPQLPTCYRNLVLKGLLYFL